MYIIPIFYIHSSPPSPQFRKHFFSQRVVSPWNDLPCDIKTAPTLNTFKSRYDKYVKEEKNKNSTKK